MCHEGPGPSAMQTDKFTAVSAVGGWQLPLAEFVVQKLKATIRFRNRPLALFILSFN